MVVELSIGVEEPTQTEARDEEEQVAPQDEASVNEKERSFASFVELKTDDNETGGNLDERPYNTDH